MTDERALVAMERIEQALDRIEKVAARPAPPPTESDEFRALFARHTALRGEVEGAIRRIDGLLEAEDA